MSFGCVVVPVFSSDEWHILEIGSGTRNGGLIFEDVIISSGGTVGILDRRVRRADDEGAVMMDCVVRDCAMLEVDGRRGGVARRRGTREKGGKKGKGIDDSQLGKSDGERR